MTPLPAKKHILKIKRIKNPDAQQSRYPYLRLDKNENIIEFDKKIIETFRSQITSDFLNTYPEVSSFYKKLASFIGCSEENLYITAGSDAAIKAVFEVFVEKGDSIVIPYPTYAMYYIYAEMFQGNLVKVNYDKNLSLADEDIIKAVLEHKPKLVCLANPNSPTGAVIPPEGIKRIVEVCSENNVIVLLDEAYYPFYPISSIGLISDYPNLVVTRTFSKAMGLASTRAGFAAGHRQIIDLLYKVRPIYETNSFAVRFAEIMIDNYEIVEENIKRINQAKEHLYDQLDKLNISYYKSQANFVLIDVGSYEESVRIGEELKKNGILIKYGFQDGILDNCIRVSVGVPEQMNIFINELKKACKK